VAIVNDGTTRGDAQASVKIEGRLGEVLPVLLSYVDQASGKDCMA
jgi:hypothetical protein